jgi:hypothetical protein
MKRILKYIFVLVVLVVGSLVSLPNANAKEGGDQYGFGSENVMTGNMPPPGSYFLNYASYYHGELRNGSGKKVVLPNGSVPNVTSEADVPRFVQVTPFKLLGGTYLVHVILPLVNLNLSVPDTNGLLTHHRKFNVGDMGFSPFALAWHKNNGIHFLAAVDFYLPTGFYSKGDPRSIGSNYYSFEPLFCFTYLPKSKWEASTKIMYNMKTTNQATNYHSGDEFHLDYFAGKHLGSWTVGGSGYFLKQVSDDTVADATVPASVMNSAGSRGQVFAVGPSISYTTRNHTTFITYWQHETLVRNRFSGDKVWFKLVMSPREFLPHQGI